MSGLSLEPILKDCGGEGCLSTCHNTRLPACQGFIRRQRTAADQAAHSKTARHNSGRWNPGMDHNVTVSNGLHVLPGVDMFRETVAHAET